MKKGLLLMGLVSCASAVAAVAYLYRTDAEVYEKVNEAAKGVTDLYKAVKGKIQDRQYAQQQAYENDVYRNQQWADDQWEALGI